MTQYHFTSWPDHGVPQFTTSLVSFVRRVQKAHNKDGGVPLLVHCSAGVGRTGTFILLDSMLEKMREENSLNVYECLVNLRKRRVLMVQTLVLLHKSHLNFQISFSYPIFCTLSKSLGYRTTNVLYLGPLYFVVVTGSVCVCARCSV